MIRRLLVITALTSIALAGMKPEEARAEVTGLPTLETSTTDAIFKVLASAFVFRPIEGAAELGSTWGGYVGLGVNMTDAAPLMALGGSSSTAYLPGGEAQLGIGIRGLTVEVGAIPTLSISGNSLSKYAGAVKYSVNRLFSKKKIPISIAVRGLYSKSSVGYTQNSGGTDIGVEFGTSAFGGNLVVSRYLGFTFLGIEPYAGVGYLNHSSTLTATASNLFGSSYAAGTTSISGSGGGLWLQAGMMLRVGIIGIAAEWDKLLDQTSYAAKFSLRF